MILPAYLAFFKKFVWLQEICKANFSAKMNPSKNAVVQEICQLGELLKNSCPNENTSIYAFLFFLFFNRWSMKMVLLAMEGWNVCTPCDLADQHTFPAQSK